MVGPTKPDLGVRLRGAYEAQFISVEVVRANEVAFAANLVAMRTVTARPAHHDFRAIGQSGDLLRRQWLAQFAHTALLFCFPRAALIASTASPFAPSGSHWMLIRHPPS